ncbi:MAG: SDR family NAD(P)-dependent oxidoreductase, partial [Alphaproteobacteria bacterium]
MGELVLSGKSALVTGGGSGIGLACARRLAADGASVTIIGRTASKLEEAAKSLAADARGGAVVQWRACDVTVEPGLEAAVELACKPTGRLDVAVANAGAGAGGSIFATGLDMWRYTMEVNLTGSFLTIKHAGQAMARGAGGSIVAISSIAGVLTHRFMTPYCTAKAGLINLGKALALELAPKGVRVNSVSPGGVLTERVITRHGSPEAAVRNMTPTHPLGRIATTDEI